MIASNIAMILGFIRGYEWLIIVLVVVLLFGGKKIPELMKGVGKGVKSFKEGLNGTDSAGEESAKSDSESKKS